MLDFDACYAAVRRRDPAADGAFFTAVRTTRIYCRPVCPARTPLAANVSFHQTAAQCQALGCRPCLRCRPETAPDSPAWQGSLTSVNRALRLIAEGALAEGGGEALAARLGMTDRHLRRLFVQHLGVTPAGVEAARRIHLAKTLIHDTRLPMTAVAHAAGYGSLRRFNEAFQALFGRPPTALRREAARGEAPGEEPSDVLRLRLAYRPPLDWGARLAGGEAPALAQARRDGPTLRGELAVDGGTVAVVVRQGPGASVRVELPGASVAGLARVAARLRRALDTPAPIPAPDRCGAPGP